MLVCGVGLVRVAKKVVMMNPLGHLHRNNGYATNVVQKDQTGAKVGKEPDG
jgi:hypothetical protein